MEIPVIFQLLCEKTLLEVFLKLIRILKTYMTLSRLSGTPKINFSEILILKKIKKKQNHVTRLANLPFYSLYRK